MKATTLPGGGRAINDSQSVAVATKVDVETRHGADNGGFVAGKRDRSAWETDKRG
jgi:hypothetical protein